MNTPHLDAVAELPRADIRLAYFDVDGTLLDRDGVLCPSALAQVRRLHSLGVKTAFATGRPPFAVAQLQAQLQFTAPGVFYTGALCETPEGRVLTDQPLALAQLQPLADAAHATGIYCEIYYRDHYRVVCATDIAREHARHLGVSPRISAPDEWPDEPVYKLLLGVDLREQPQGLTALEQGFGGLHFAYAHLPSRPHWQFASVVAASVDKTALFAQLLVHHGLDASQVIAFGDGGSDIEFLRAAGVGVAMDNGGEAVKAAANYVTRASWADGVAYALERFIR